MASRKQYLRTLLERYLRARKRQKGLILDEYCRNTGQNRKYVIRKISRMASTEPRPPRKRAEARSPFPWLAIHSDNNNAFINGQLYD